MRPVRDELQNIRPNGRLALALTVMDRTLETMGPIEPDDVREHRNEGLSEGHEDLRAGAEKITLSEEYGTSQMISALLACSDVPEGLSGEVLYGVLAFCREAVLDREDTEVYGLEAEPANARCGGVIAFQKNCVSESLGNRGGSM